LGLSPDILPRLPGRPAGIDFMLAGSLMKVPALLIVVKNRFPDT